MAGWRNILKYKTQNLISVVSLSVGTLLFAIVIWIAGMLWQNIIYTEWDKNSLQVEFYECELDYDQMMEQMGDSVWNMRRLSTDVLRKLQQCKTVDELVWRGFTSYQNLEVKDLEGKSHALQEVRYKSVSPNYFKVHHYRSALTGEEIGMVKPGTIIISSQTRNKFLDKDTNPVGYEISTFITYKRIADVFESKAASKREDGVFVVLGDDEEMKMKCYDVEGNDAVVWFAVRAEAIRVSLKEGCSMEDFKIEVAKRMPQYKMHVVTGGIPFPRAILDILMFLIIFLGASVLLIGLSGYLKMQIQLFNLRSREMALRRCNGAKSVHLFMLLACELLLVFILVGICSILLTMGITEYAIPRLVFVGIDIVEMYSFDVKEILGVEAWITLATFFVSLIIACWSVRKVVKMPVGMVAGRSYSPRTLWNSTMQVIQYFVATILFFCIVAAFWVIQHNMQNFETVNEPNFYKRLICMQALDTPDLDKIPSVEYVGRIFYLSYPRPVANELDSADTEEVEMVGSTCTLDAGTLKRLNMNVKEEMTKDVNTLNKWSAENYTIPVCAKMKEAEAVAKLLGVKYDDSKMMYAGNDRCVKLGYLPLIDTRRDGGINPINSYMVYPRMDLGYVKNLIAMEGAYEYGPKDVLIFPKEGRYSDALEDVRDMIRKAHPYLPTNASLPVFSAFEVFFKTLQIVRMVHQLCLLLVFVSLCSIILSVYSSVSLETRGRQKEVAIRKVHGAKTKDIVMLFSKYHVRTLIIAFVITAVFALALFLGISISGGFPDGEESLNILYYFSIPYLTSIAVITLVTFLTIWQKIYKVAHTNAALMVKKE